MMRNLKTLFAIAGLTLLPATVFAQASIAGVVKDTSGAVLPGVTVEAASPALIEKTRSMVQDGRHAGHTNGHFVQYDGVPFEHDARHAQYGRHPRSDRRLCGGVGRAGLGRGAHQLHSA